MSIADMLNAEYSLTISVAVVNWSFIATQASEQQATAATGSRVHWPQDGQPLATAPGREQNVNQALVGELGKRNFGF